MREILMAGNKRVGIYLRVSRDTQTTTNQLMELRRVAEQRGWHVADIYEDHGISGSRGRDQRPAFDKLCKDAARGKLDMVRAWSIDRLGRSLHHVVSFMVEMVELGVGLYLHQQAVDTSTPAGRAMVSMCGVFAEFERCMTVERIKSGLARARTQGKRLGRPRTAGPVEDRIRELRARGMGVLRIAREVGVGVSVVQRLAA
jgi:DNA invertase Pin-like site-specific DNA recombinase